MLILIGLGLGPMGNITVEAIDAAKSCDVLFLDAYTSETAPVAELEKTLGKKIQPLTREKIESGEILPYAEKNKVGLLVGGDPLVATTHVDLLLRAKKRGIKTAVVHGCSIFSAIAETGLQIYKFGRAATVAFWEKNYKPTSFYDVIVENRERGLHTLLFLDLRDGEYMTPKCALEILLEIEKQKKKNAIDEVVVCSRLGYADSKILYGKVSDLLAANSGMPAHVLIAPGKLHELEKEYLEGMRIHEKT